MAVGTGTSSSKRQRRQIGGGGGSCRSVRRAVSVTPGWGLFEAIGARANTAAAFAASAVIVGVLVWVWSISLAPDSRTGELAKNYGPALARRAHAAVAAVLPRSGEVVPAIEVTLLSARTDYSVREPAGAAVELTILVGNASSGATSSTSITWEPEFAASYAFLESAPPAWRVRVEETGWVVLDTAGVLPGEHGTFRVWFAPVSDGSASGADLSPLVRVVADGEIEVGEGRATSAHEQERLAEARRFQFDRGLPAILADHVSAVPATRHSAFGFGVGLAVILSTIVLVGGGCALKTAADAMHVGAPGALQLSARPALTRYSGPGA